MRAQQPAISQAGRSLRMLSRTLPSPTPLPRSGPGRGAAGGRQDTHRNGGPLTERGDTHRDGGTLAERGALTGTGTLTGTGGLAGRGPSRTLTGPERQDTHRNGGLVGHSRGAGGTLTRRLCRSRDADVFEQPGRRDCAGLPADQSRAQGP